MIKYTKSVGKQKFSAYKDKLAEKYDKKKKLKESLKEKIKDKVKDKVKHKIKDKIKEKIKEKRNKKKKDKQDMLDVNDMNATMMDESVSYSMDDDNTNGLLQKYYINGGRGLVLIVAIKDYTTLTGGIESKWSNLKGTIMDKKTLKRLFKNEYQYNTICNDNDIVSYDDFHELITKMRDELVNHYNKYDTFILAFSGHGSQDGIYLSDGHCFGRVALYKFFNGLNCKGFKDKPKVFLVDACKGIDEAPAQRVAAKGSLNVGSSPTHPDDNIIIFNANSDEYVSWDTQNGGILMQSLNTVLKSNKNKISLDDMTKLIDIRMKELGGNRQMQTLGNIQYGIKQKIYFCKPKNKAVISNGFKNDFDVENATYSAGTFITGNKALSSGTSKIDHLKRDKAAIQNEEENNDKDENVSNIYNGIKPISAKKKKSKFIYVFAIILAIIVVALGIISHG